MALNPLKLTAGIVSDLTNYANTGGWFASNKVRFFESFPQKIGGWVGYTASTFTGVCRSLFNWLTPGGYNFLALGTSSRIYIEAGGILNDISPAGFPAGNTINTNGYGWGAGGWGGFSTTGGTVPAFTLNGVAITSTTGGFSFTSQTPTTPVIAAGMYLVISGTLGGSGAITGYTNPTVYYVSAATLTTFTLQTVNKTTLTTTTGTPTGLTYGYYPYGWGVASSSPIYQPLRLVYFDKHTGATPGNLDLVFNTRYTIAGALDGIIYYWPFSTAFTAAVTLASLSTAGGFTGADVPTGVTQILFDAQTNILLAFGGTPFGTSGAPDPLLIRWASQSNYLNWTPSDDAGLSTSGYIRVQNGSAIMRAVNNLGNILVFTESSLTLVQYTASYPYLFSQSPISSNITFIGPNTLIVINNIVYWMGFDRFFTYTGTVGVIPCPVREHVFTNINLAQQDQFFASANSRYNEVWWFYCSANSNVIDSYVVYNYGEKPCWYWGDCTGGMVRTAWSDSPLRNFPQGASAVANGTNTDYAATGDYYIYDHEKGNDWVNTVSGVNSPISAFIQSSDIDIPLPSGTTGDKFSLVRRIIPDVTFNTSTCPIGISPSVQFTLNPRNFPGAAYMATNQENSFTGFPAPSTTGTTSLTLETTQTTASNAFPPVYPPNSPSYSGTTVTVEQYTNQVFVRARARQIGITVQSSGVLGVHWKLGVPRVDVRPDGTRG